MQASTRFPRGAAFLVLSAASTLAGVACGKTSEGRRDIILVTIDTLRSDHVGLYGYQRATTPEIDRWFRDAAIYERCYSTEASTSPSVTSILTGELPQDHRVRLFYQIVPKETKLIPELLPSEYQTAAFVSNMVLTDEAMGIADRFDHFDDYVDEKESMRQIFERDARRTTDAVLSWLRTERDPRRPLFLWVHYIDPHGPYHPPEDWGVRFHSDESVEIAPEKIPFYTREPGVTDGWAYVDRYDSEIAFVDAQVGRLLDGYAEMRPIDDALVLLTADHGESMMEHSSWFTHGYHVWNEITHVPLLVRGPGVDAGRFDTPASGIDVATTILRFAGTTPPSYLAGADLADPGSLAPERIVYSEAGQKRFQWRAAVQGERKWIAQIRGNDRRILGQKLFDLASDPHELGGRSIDPGDPLAKSLIRLIQADPDPSGIPADAREGIRLSAPKVAPGASAEQLERLKRLGYAE